MSETSLSAMALPTAARADRTIGPVSKGHFTGHLIVGEGAGRVMEVESHLEMNVALVLSNRPDIRCLENQIQFSWIDDGRERVLFFDFRAYLADGQRMAIMVKPSRKLRCPIFTAEAARISTKVTRSFADRVTIMTERHLDPVELYNAKFLAGLRDIDAEADSAVRRASKDLTGAVKISELASSASESGRGFRAVGRLIRQRELRLVGRTRIELSSYVTREAAYCSISCLAPVP